MTGIDLIVATPWIAFAVLLANVCFRLLRSNQASRREQGRPPAHSAAPMPRHRRERAGQEKDSCPNPQETRWPRKTPMGVELATGWDRSTRPVRDILNLSRTGPAVTIRAGWLATAGSRDSSRLSRIARGNT